jgi:hypothetical protein
MSDRRVSAILGALMVLLVAGLVDGMLLTAVQLDGTATALVRILGDFVIASGVLLLGFIARSPRSRLVSLFYLVVGGSVTLLFVIDVAFVGPVDQFFPASFPASAVHDLDQALGRGPLNAVAIIGIAMLLIGLAGIVVAVRAQTPPPGPVVATQES